MSSSTTAAQAFIERWKGVTASELSTAQSFILDLCALLGVDRPHPDAGQGYMFERPITFVHGDGSTSAGRIDCYKRGHFVLEAKKLKAGAHTKGFDDGMLRARAQGEGYARALPAQEGRPPFVLVVDVGHVIEVYSEFSRTGGTYTPFPDPRSHRIAIDDLANPDILQRLRLVWTRPDDLNPALISAKVTMEVSDKLAKLAMSLEAAQHSAHTVAAYLSRCLFSMFAEDIELLPKGSFQSLLKQHRESPETIQQLLRGLWADMDKGGFSMALVKPVLRFNGKLFKEPDAPGYSLLLSREQIDLLIEAASCNWREVEPAIFGTLLERALHPSERHALGAHYTPRSYVERLVQPTVIEPLRAEWADAQAAAITIAREAAAIEAEAPPPTSAKNIAQAKKLAKTAEEKWQEARQLVRGFLHRLATVRVLDPACGSANFLYVTLEHLKRLEGEVLNQLRQLGDTQDSLDLGRETVTLRQLLGIELNERAAALAELVLWIGFLQWHIRTNGNAAVAEPVVHDYGNIEHRDAVLVYDSKVQMTDEGGQPLLRWDGTTFKTHPVTGQQVPDESARAPQWRYENARQAEWPKADFIVGNPPFIGNKRMREALGDGYADALRATWPAVPESADFVMYWWHKAAETVRQGQAERFGLITTNSLTMIFNRRVIEAHQKASPPLSLAYAVPDHPWVDSADGAAVRISMSVGVRGTGEGKLQTVTKEREAESGEADVELATRQGIIHSDLRVGANLTRCVKLAANSRLSYMGMIPLGAGFWVDQQRAEALGLGTVPGLEQHVRRYVNGKDLTATSRGILALDFYGLTEPQLRERFPAAWQWLHDEVKPKRDQDKRPSRRRNWWLWGESVPKFREAARGLRRYIGTAETAKHRIFVFIDGDVLPDQKVRAVASDDALMLGVLSSRVHVEWAIASGGRLGVGNDPVYNTTRCFEPFPFPDLDPTGVLAERIRALAEQIDAHRKNQLAVHPDATLTATYNVLEKLRSGAALTHKEKVIHEHGLVGVLKSLHDELDAAVQQAYGWEDLTLPADTDILLQRLVDLNAQRAAEEANGLIRWLRPEFQNAQGGVQAGLDDDATEGTQDEDDDVAVPAPAIAQKTWPSGITEQIKAVAEVFTASDRPMDLERVASYFSGRGRWRDRLPTLLETLTALGRIRHDEMSDLWVKA